MDNQEQLLKINSAIQKAYARCLEFNNICVCISGGADSDVMLDLLLRVCPKEKLRFVFFDTGIEYKATKEHLDYLENKYDIVIDRQKAFVPVPLGCKKYGVPFISKFISEMIGRLQEKGFDFKNDGNLNYEELSKKYKNCESALKWWCSENENNKNNKSKFNINRSKGLKEFIILNPPTFKISSKCCNGAKKNTGKIYDKKVNADLKCMGLRKMEGGIRTTKYKSCFDYNYKEKTQNFRPIWWLDDKDKQVYIQLYDVNLSDCYTKYGMKRTGCAGCPFNSRFEEDLEIIKKYEPKLYKAVNNIFKDSYEYTRAYRKFKSEMKTKNDNQLSIFDL